MHLYNIDKVQKLLAKLERMSNLLPDLDGSNLPKLKVGRNIDHEGECLVLTGTDNGRDMDKAEIQCVKEITAAILKLKIAYMANLNELGVITEDSYLEETPYA